MAKDWTFGEEWMRLLLPSLAAAEAGATLMRGMAEAFAEPAPAPAPRPEPLWASPNEIVLELRAARLRRFDLGEGGIAGRKTGVLRRHGARPLLVCAPFAVHGAQVADLYAGHSLMHALLAHCAPLYLIEWLSAGADEAGRRIDDYLADLNVIVDSIGGLADFIGLCQGGWLSLIYAARFPSKAGRLALAGAPVDIDAGESPLSLLAQSTPIETFREIVALGGGLARGEFADRVWRPLPESDEAIHGLLQSDADIASAAFAACAEAFRHWAARTLDLPGAYYLDVVENFYKNNALARGAFIALGKKLDLGLLRAPLFLIAAEDDDVAAPAQTFACADLVGAPARSVERRLVPGGHLGLFLGAKTLRTVWPEVVDWLEPARRVRRN